MSYSPCLLHSSGRCMMLTITVERQLGTPKTPLVHMPSMSTSGLTTCIRHSRYTTPRRHRLPNFCSKVSSVKRQLKCLSFLVYTFERCCQLLDILQLRTISVDLLATLTRHRYILLFCPCNDLINPPWCLQIPCQETANHNSSYLQNAPSTSSSRDQHHIKM